MTTEVQEAHTAVAAALELIGGLPPLDVRAIVHDEGPGGQKYLVE